MVLHTYIPAYPLTHRQTEYLSPLSSFRPLKQTVNTSTIPSALGAAYWSHFTERTAVPTVWIQLALFALLPGERRDPWTKWPTLVAWYGFSSACWYGKKPELFCTNPWEQILTSEEEDWIYPSYSIYPSIRWSVNAAPWVSTLCWESTVSLHRLPLYISFLTADRESLSWLPRCVTQSTFPSCLGLPVHAWCTHCMFISSCPSCPLLLSEVSWYFIAEWTQLSSLERNAKLFLLHLYHMLWNSYPGDLQERVNSGLQWDHPWRALALSAAKKACSCYLRASIPLQTQS